MEEPAKETVIIVHGTWAAPNVEITQWYEKRGDFVFRLDRALEERNSPARCWAHCPTDNPFPYWPGAHIFCWSGENNWVERSRAATALVRYVRELHDQGWRCHIVAHSHGGNVVFDALPQIAKAVESQAAPSKIVMMGTPFINLKAQISRWRERGLMSFLDTNSITIKIRGILAILFITVPLIMFILAIFVILYIIYAHGFKELPESLYISIYISMVVVFVAVFLYTMMVISLQKAVLPETFGGGLDMILRLINPWLKLGDAKSRTTESAADAEVRDVADLGVANIDVLAINSEMDEARQLLSNLRNSSNPLATNESLLTYIFRRLSLRLNTAREIESLLGFKTFEELSKSEKNKYIANYLSGIVATAGIILVFLFMIIESGFDIRLIDLLYVISMFFTLTYIFKLFQGRDVSGTPIPFANSFIALSAIPTDIVTYFVRQESWSVLVSIAMGLEGYRFELPAIQNYPGRLSGCHIFYEDLPQGALDRALAKRNEWVKRRLDKLLSTTAADLPSLLEIIARDLTLVHGAYYTDDEAVARIADWIAGRG